MPRPQKAAKPPVPKLRLDEYFALQAEVFAYFGYVEDWRVIPLDDRRSMFWRLDTDSVTYSPDETFKDDNSLYVDEIYTQRHLPKWVYRGTDFTMICVDTHTDGNKFLAIFDNAKERRAK